MALTGDDIAHFQTGDVGTDLDDLAGEFMPTDHGHRNGFLGPGIPVVNMDVGAADGGFMDFDEHVIAADDGHRYIIQPQSLFGMFFY